MHDGNIRTITDVRHVPMLQKSVLSVGALSRLGMRIIIDGENLRVTKGSLVVMKGVRVDDIYMLRGEIVFGDSVVSTDCSVPDSTQLWHLRLGHVDEESLEVLKKRRLIVVDSQLKPSSCEDCSIGKKKRVTFDVGRPRATEFLE